MLSTVLEGALLFIDVGKFIVDYSRGHISGSCCAKLIVTRSLKHIGKIGCALGGLALGLGLSIFFPHLAPIFFVVCVGAGLLARFGVDMLSKAVEKIIKKKSFWKHFINHCKKYLNIDSLDNCTLSVLEDAYHRAMVSVKINLY